MDKFPVLLNWQRIFSRACSLPACDKAAEADGDDGRLRAAGQHDVGLALADVVSGRHKTVVGRRARGGD